MDFELRGKAWLNEKEVLSAVEKAAVQRLAKCAALVEGEAKRLVSKGAEYERLRNDKGQFKRGAPLKNNTPFPRTITGNLRNSIKYARTSHGTFVIGPTTTAFYGRVHEFGAVISVTPKMRGFLLHQYGWRVRAATIVIPKRPYMRPALDRVKGRFAELFKDLPIGGPSS